MIRRQNIKNKGFTLIELLVVVAIIGLLASIILASLNTATAKAKTAAVKEEFTQIEDQLDNIRDTKNEVMGLVTGNYCTICSFSASSKANTQTSALAVNKTSWSNLGYSSPPVDPWGTPYSFDENELEGSSSNCTNDTVTSAGPDGIFFTSDDIGYNVMHFVCPN
jgi:prepilin-type N-terminal cleavage/methylation domain-containing protein